LDDLKTLTEVDLKIGPNGSDVFDHIITLKNIEVRQTGRGTDRVCRICPAMYKRAKCVSAFVEDFNNTLA